MLKLTFNARKFTFDLYAKIFLIIFWQPFVWNLIKPKNGVIDNKSNWFHRHAVKCLNQCRSSKNGWVMMSFLGFMVRDPYSHPMKSAFRYSDKHLFVSKIN